MRTSTMPDRHTGAGITQSLYEKKLISYPRTACRFLPEDVYATLPAVMEKMLARKEFRTYVARLDIAGRKGRHQPAEDDGTPCHHHHRHAPR